MSSHKKRRGMSISETIANMNQGNSNDLSGRNYVFGSFKHSQLSNLMAQDGSESMHYSSSPAVHSTISVNEETATLAGVGVLEGPDDENVVFEDEHSSYEPVSFQEEHYQNLHEDFLNDSSSLLHDPHRSYSTIGEIEEMLPDEANDTDLENQAQKRGHNPSLSRFSKLIRDASMLDTHTVINHCVTKPISYLPAVFLGTLLNILDALSYGMIMFPIGEQIFSGMGAAGISMFYLSCVVSQLVYSLGGSGFSSGIGSEMIEATPFFHSMAMSVLKQLKGREDSVIPTTIVAFAVSSVVTGLVFFLLGKCRLGSLVGFFPRHILVGCIGGVGYFLTVTGIEVSSRIEGGIEYSLPVFHYLTQPLVFLQWSIPWALAIILVIVQHFNHNALIVPLYFILVFVGFHAIVSLVPSWSLEQARQYGWVFESPPSNEPWYGFYKYYDFSLVDWMIVMKEFPIMLALTFFGILHVPINVPALAVSVGMDQFDVDRELVAHGVSNVVSGLIGSIQNYLVYTNSVLFFRAGADSRLSGVMLAAATAGVMFAGPVVIGYIPVCVVGALIYLLGYELLKEALYDTRGRLARFEYLTIVVIVVTMGAWDFVYGILVGILLACLSFVVQAARRPIISGVFTGEYARSIVLRHPKQQAFLQDVGNQIYVLKLGGSLFFGSIGGLEKKIRYRFQEPIFSREPIRYLILDLNNVFSLDFSAVEGLRRIRNLMMEKNCFLLISSVSSTGPTVNALRDAGLWELPEHEEKIQLFNTLNSALEWCENMFLKTYSDIKSRTINSRGKSITKPTPAQKLTSAYDRGVVSSPRESHIFNAATRQVHEEVISSGGILTRGNIPLNLFMATFQVLSKLDESEFAKIIPFFEREVLPLKKAFHNSAKDPPCFYIVESGQVTIDYTFPHTGFKLSTSALPLTAFGNVAVHIWSHRNTVYSSSSTTETIVWKLVHSNAVQMQKKQPKLYNELLNISIRLLSERFDSITSNLLVAS
ncbi:hypothetical protein LJB42_000189 [Komagataella kurtzmanii]|nr:hypothetical protein LJB42_000189 [Komagataella kurtzmanii]